MRNRKLVPEDYRRQAESGQAIVLIALLMILLLGIAGVAIDGGGLFFLKRDTQNAVDAAVLVATAAMCNNEGSSVANDRAVAIATRNGYTNGVDNATVTVNTNLAASDLQPGYTGNSADYVRVTITAHKPSYFIQVVYPGPLAVTSQATAHCHTGFVGPVGGGNAIIALKANGKAAFKLNGNGTNTITGGGVFVNSNDGEAMFVNGNGTLAADAASVVGGYVKKGGASGSINPTPTTGVPPITDPLANLAEPVAPGGACTSVANINGSDNVTLSPGKYCGIQMTGGTLTLTPGLYYFTGDFRMTGGALTANQVMFFMDTGTFNMTGTGTVNWTAPTSGDWKGMMLFMGRGNTSGVQIAGQGNLAAFSGTIYAPDSDVDLSGQGDSTIVSAQIIASTVQVGGNGNLTINYDPAKIFWLYDPSSVDVSQ